MRIFALLLTACSASSSTTPSRVDAPITSRDLTVTSDVVLAVHQRGPDAAPQTLIVVNGGPGLSHDYIEPVESLASAQLRVVFYDQRGTGKSGRPPTTADGKPDPAQHTLAHHVADLEAIRAALHAPRVHLLGHSWGSLIVQRYAIEHPDHVASLATIGGIPATAEDFGVGVKAFGTKLDALIEQGVVAADRPKAAADGDCAGVAALLPVYLADPHAKVGPAFARTSCHNLSGVTLQSLPENFDFRPELAKLQLPALVMVGDSDPFGVGWADALAKAIPHARRVVFPHCGHLVWEECAEPFQRELASFLSTAR